jgi:hypothetical protein
MAHFAKIGLNSKVLNVVVISDDVLKDEAGNEVEELGRQFLENSTGWPIWKQTSFNTKGGVYYTDYDNTIPGDDQSKVLRANFASVGYIYDETNDIFYKPKFNDYVSWTLNTTKGIWEAPIAFPTANNYDNGYPRSIEWDESNQRWLSRTEGSETNNLVWNPDTSAWDNI